MIFKVIFSTFEEIGNTYKYKSIKQVTPRYNMLLLPDNAFIAIIENTYYLVTI